LADHPTEKLELLDPGLRAIVEESRAISLRDFQQATAERAAYGAGMKAFMRDHDFLVTPTVAVPAFDTPLITPFDASGQMWMEWTPFTYPFNLTQQPAASVPCGFTKDGLPIGLQIVGRIGEDARVLQAAHALEKVLDLADRHPPEA
jgi:aspartyl-tRNA(Asn)/glutamyl-tRNA(Gln) amidotransferase subunit A